jgi:hypothetical protein
MEGSSLLAPRKWARARLGEEQGRTCVGAAIIAVTGEQGKERNSLNLWIRDASRSKFTKT